MNIIDVREEYEQIEQATYPDTEEFTNYKGEKKLINENREEFDSILREFVRDQLKLAQRSDLQPFSKYIPISVKNMEYHLKPKKRTI